MKLLIPLLFVFCLQDAPTTPDTQESPVPPVRKITVEFKETPITEAIEKLGEESGLAVGWSYVDKNETVTFSVKDATALQAFDALCRASGKLNYNIQLQSKYDQKTGKSVSLGVRVGFYMDKFPERPTIYSGHYKLEASNLTLTRATGFGGNDKIEGSIRLRLMWPQNVSPEALCIFRVDEVLDDQDRPLQSKKTNAYSNFLRIRPQKSWHQSYSEPSFRFTYPESDVKKISLVKGMAVLRYTQKAETLSWEDPEKTAGEAREHSGLSIKLDSVKSSGKSVRVTVKITGKWKKMKDPYEKIQKPSYSDRYPFMRQDVRLLGEDGKPLKQTAASSSGSSTRTLTVTFENPDGKALKAVELPCVTKYHYDEVPFVLKDIKLP